VSEKCRSFNQIASASGDFWQDNTTGKEQKTAQALVQIQNLRAAIATVREKTSNMQMQLTLFEEWRKRDLEEMHEFTNDFEPEP
jgi:hypothetical protein